MTTKPKKYTAEWVEKELKTLLEEAKEKDYIYNSQLFLNREYSRTRYSEWRKDFHDNIRIRALYEKLDEFFETQLVVKGLTKQHNSTITKFCFYSHFTFYNYKTIYLMSMFMSATEGVSF